VKLRMAPVASTESTTAQLVRLQMLNIVWAKAGLQQTSLQREPVSSATTYLRNRGKNLNLIGNPHWLWAISPVTLTIHKSDRQHSETEAQNEATNNTQIAPDNAGQYVHGLRWAGHFVKLQMAPMASTTSVASTAQLARPPMLDIV